MNTDCPRHVIKLGGSLLSLSDWGERLVRFLASSDEEVLEKEGKKGGQVARCGGVLVVGGGGAADMVRAWCATHEIDDATGHELAVDAMRFNAGMVVAVLRKLDVDYQWVARGDDLDRLHDGCLAIIDPVTWLAHADVPRVWQFTSDSIAARVATDIEAGRLTLLKSTLPNDDDAVASAGIVDDWFARASASLPWVELVNLRDDALPAWRLR